MGAVSDDRLIPLMMMEWTRNGRRARVEESRARRCWCTRGRVRPPRDAMTGRREKMWVETPTQDGRKSGLIAIRKKGRRRKKYKRKKGTRATASQASVESGQDGSGRVRAGGGEGGDNAHAVGMQGSAFLSPAGYDKCGGGGGPGYSGAAGPQRGTTTGFKGTRSC